MTVIHGIEEKPKSFLASIYQYIKFKYMNIFNILNFVIIIKVILITYVEGSF